MRDLFRASAFGPAIEAAGLVAMDIGSRGGFDAELLPLAWAVDAIGFEPEPAAFAELGRLPATPWRSCRWLPSAVGPHSGPAVLHVPTDPIGASLLEHDPAVGRRFGLDQLTTVERTIAVETLTLGDAAARWSLPAPTYLKLDVEGAELSILESAGPVLDGLVALKTEASFIPARKNQPLAADLDAFMRNRGFVLMDILHPARWRTRSVSPHPYSWRGVPAYSRGQIAQCDLLFFRDPASIDDSATALKAAVVSMAFGFFDHALELLERPAATAQLGFKPRGELARLSRLCGRRAALSAIRAHLRDLVPLLRSLTVGVPG